MKEPELEKLLNEYRIAISKLNEFKELFKELGYSPGIIEILDSMINSENSIKDTYQFILGLEPRMLQYLKKCRTFFDDEIIERPKNRFFYMKNELKKAMERGRESCRCRDVFYIPNYIV